MPLEASWRELVELTVADERNLPRVERLVKGVLGEASAGDVKLIAQLCSGGSTKEKYAALGLILELLRRNDGRLTAGERGVCLEAAKEIAWAEFPFSRLGMRALQALREISAEEGENCLVGKMGEVSRMTDDQARWLVLNLCAVRSRRAVSALRQARDLPPSAQVARDGFLKEFGGDGEDRPV